MFQIIQYPELFCQFCSVSWDKFLKIWRCTVDDDTDDIDPETSIKIRRTVKGKESKPTTRVSRYNYIP